MQAIGEAAGAEDATVTIWSIGRWPLTLALLVVMIAALYNLAPGDSRPRGLFSAGSVAAVLVWLVASVGFEVWVAEFASYDATYGTLAGVIAFAVWLWISNLALLFGLVLDLELRAARSEGNPAGHDGAGAGGRRDLHRAADRGQAVLHVGQPDAG